MYSSEQHIILKIYLQKNLLRIGVICSLLLMMGRQAYGRDITFCGESIPMDKDFVADKLMNVIKSQLKYVPLSQLRRDSEKWFPMIEYYLRASGLPEDLKYIPIVESGFRNATSPVGAQGFWQFMPATARSWGLEVSSLKDERNDPVKATQAACKELASLYRQIKAKYNVYSWALTAASYNYGIGNMFTNINRQGKDYFSMSLNPETAVYVYKIIAIKELFEFPELYMKNFSYNVFNDDKKKAGEAVQKTEDQSAFNSLEIKVNEKDGHHPDSINVVDVKAPKAGDLKEQSKIEFSKARLVDAVIEGKYSDFKDGDSVMIRLVDKLQLPSYYRAEGSVVKGVGWVIDGRVYIDLGFRSGNIILYDSKSRQGIAVKGLKGGEGVLLRVQN
jgi:membrane-bound lytic murein transglycosylase D